MTPSSPIATLTDAFERPKQSAKPTVVLSWPAVPVEVVRAVGLHPVYARGAASTTPAADTRLEPSVFPSRLRHLVEAVLTGQLTGAIRVVLPRTSDADYKCFLYLREFHRRGIVRSLAPILLFDLLQSRGEDVRVYNAKRTRDLFNELAFVTDQYPSLDDLRDEIRRTNTARRAARRLASLRRGFPRVTGTEALPLLGAFWMLPPDEYATLANEAADFLERRPPLAGPRVLLAGAPVDGPALHAAIESHGAVVVTEIGPWGSGAAGTDVETNGDPIAALADRYCGDTLGPRTPVEELWRAVDQMLDEVDAVVVSLPPDDTVFGWDYPALRDRLDVRQIPHLCIQTDPHEQLTDRDHVRLVKLIAAAAVPAETRHG